MTLEKTSIDYMPTLDGVRGAACLMVFLYHVDSVFELYYLDGALGALGVLTFFTLSGFLMGTLYCHQPFDYGHVSKYAVSRLSRITPAYYIAILFCLALYLLMPAFPYQMTPVNTARSFAFLGSEGVFWSIPPEVQFYAFFLLIWLAADRARKGKFLWLSVTILLSALMVLTREKWGGILLPSKAHIFLYGVMAAFLLNILKRKNFSLNAVAQIVAVAAAGLYFQNLHNFDVPIGDPEIQVFYNDPLLPALIALAVMAMSKTTWFTYIFQTGFMRLMGAASFSIYLFHEPILYLITNTTNNFAVQLPLAVAIAFCAPLMFHFYAERVLNKKAKDAGLAICGNIERRVSTGR